MPSDSGKSVGTVYVETSIRSTAMRDNVAIVSLQIMPNRGCREYGIDSQQHTFEANSVEMSFQAKGVG